MERASSPRTVACRPSRGFDGEGLDQRCELVDLDLLEPASLLRVLNERDVRLVFHLAARTIVADANREPLAAFEVNVRGTYNLLEACRLLDGPASSPRVVVASSYHAYGRQAAGAYSERTALRPRHPYDVSKACADMIARSYAETYEMPVAITRMANIYGGGDLNWSRIVPDTARALARGARPVIASDGTPGARLPLRRGRGRGLPRRRGVARGPGLAGPGLERRRPTGPSPCSSWCGR